MGVAGDEGITSGEDGRAGLGEEVDAVGRGGIGGHSYRATDNQHE